MKKTSLKDIAKKVGVSTAAVSYVLSKGEDNRVSVKMAEKIRKAAREMNYRPNQIAKSLKLGKTFTFGLIVADISNPFFANIARVIEDEAKNLDYTVIFGSSDEDVEKSDDLINVFLNRQVDGFIITPVEGSEKQIERLEQMNIPYVLIDRYFPEISSSYVVIDNFRVSYDAVSELIRQGSRKVAMLFYGNGLIHMNERIRGYREALDNNGIEMQRNWIRKVSHRSLEKDVKTAIDQLYSDGGKVNGLFFATNKIAIQALKYLDRMGIKIPEDVAVVSFDQGEVFDFFYCPMTYVKQPIEDIGKTAVSSLISQINMGNKGTRKVTLDADLIIGQSSGRKK